MFCPNCGEEAEKDVAFCEKCGVKIFEEGDKSTSVTNSQSVVAKHPLLFLILAVVALGAPLTFFIADEKTPVAPVVNAGIPSPTADYESKFTQMQSEIEHLKSMVSTSQNQGKVVQLKQTQTPASSPMTPAQMSNPEIIKKVKPATVYIKTTDASGSGMIFDANGYILTNNHVVEGNTWATVKLTDGRSFYATVLGTDSIIDLAVLKVEATGLPAVILGDSDFVNQGDNVYTMGFPFGFEGDPSFKEGTLSRKFNEGGITYFEISAEIHPGNSGGPLINNTGQVIGINTFTYGKSIGGIFLGETIKFAIPINFAKDKLEALKNGSGSPQSSSVGTTIGTPPATYSFSEYTAQCKNSYGENSYYTGNKSSQGGPICGCTGGSQWNSSQTACVVDGAQWCQTNNPGLYADAQYYANGNFSCACYGSPAGSPGRAAMSCKVQH